MDIVKLVLLDFGVDARGAQTVRINYEALIGEPRTTGEIVLHKGDTLTIQAPIEPKEPEPERC